MARSGTTVSRICVYEFDQSSNVIYRRVLQNPVTQIENVSGPSTDGVQNPARLPFDFVHRRE